MLIIEISQVVGDTANDITWMWRLLWMDDVATHILFAGVERLYLDAATHARSAFDWVWMP